MGITLKSKAGAYMDLNLTGRSALVIGASAGLGRATAIEFARAGAAVTAVARDTGKLEALAAEVPGVIPFIGDVRNPGVLESAVAAASTEGGQVDVLFNNGGGPKPGGFADLTDDDWQQAFNATLLSYVRAIRLVLPGMRASGWGRILNNTSSSVRAAIDGLLLSNAFRLAVLGLTQSLASEVASDGILINVLAAGRFDTDRVAGLDEGRAARHGVSVGDFRRSAEQGIPVGRYGVPEEFARAAVFYGSGANTYITGQAVLIDGGMYRGY